MMVTHPGINLAHDCLTSVIKRKMFTHCCVSPLETILCSIENRIKCHTKIHTELVLLFSLSLKTFAMVDKSLTFIIFFS